MLHSILQNSGSLYAEYDIKKPKPKPMRLLFNISTYLIRK